MDYSRQYLTFESKTNNNVISWIAEVIVGDYTSKTISASTDNGVTWTAYTSTTGGTTIATLNVGDKILIKGENRAYGYGSVNKFGSTGQFKAYGNVMSLIYGDNFVGQTTLTNENTYAFQSLFHSCSGLISAENLILPATTLANGCYISMFNGTSITIAPELPATTLAGSCYFQMFFNCTSLVNAPQLPATTLTGNCYTSMFTGCTSLTTAPELPATELADGANGCYGGMFLGCTKLNYIKAMFTTTPSTLYTNQWVSGVAANGTFVKNSAATWNVTGVNGIPSGWTVETATE